MNEFIVGFMIGFCSLGIQIILFCKNEHVLINHLRFIA